MRLIPDAWRRRRGPTPPRTPEQMVLAALARAPETLRLHVDARHHSMIRVDLGGVEVIVDTTLQNHGSWTSNQPRIDIVAGGETMSASAAVGRAWRRIQHEAARAELGMEAGRGRERDDVDLHDALRDRLAVLPAPAEGTRWQPVGDAMRMDVQQRKLISDGYARGSDGLVVNRAVSLLWHDRYGCIWVPSRVLDEARGMRWAEAVSSALGDRPTTPVIATGDARSRRAARILEDAVARWPDMVDRSGTPIAPLVHTHLPRLLRAHRTAADLEPASRLGAADRELAEGLDRMTAAVEEGLAVLGEEAASALATEIGFLRLRHPGDDRDM